MNIPENIMRYSKELANAETINRAKAKECISKLKRAAFELSGGYPFVFDVISYACTHFKDCIKDTDQTHYFLDLHTEVLEDFAFDGYAESKNYLKKEIYRTLTSPIRKVLPFFYDGNYKYTIDIELIRINIIYKEDVLYSTLVSKNKQNKYISMPKREVLGYRIYFYKPLFKNLISGEAGRAWFPLPKAFQAKLIHTIKTKGNSSIFKGYGTFGNFTNYRKLYLYLNLHDNSKADEIYYDGIDMTIRCLPSNVVFKNGKPFIHDWYTSHQFLQKGLTLFNLMAQDGLMDGVKLVPTSVFYEKPIRKFRVKIARPDKQKITDFKNETPYSPNSDDVERIFD